MPASSLLHVDAATLYVGDDDPTNSQHLVLHNVKLPTLSEKTRDFSPGGAPGSIKLGMRKLEPFETSFKLEGVNLTVMNKFMLPERVMYTMRANIRDVSNQVDIPLKAIINARMVEVDMGEFGTDDSVESDYKLAEMMYYELTIANQEKYYFNFLEGHAGVRVDGVPVFQNIASNLGLI